MLVPIGFAVGGAALVAGAITGGLSLSKAGDITEACGDTCPPDQEDALDSAIMLANISNVTFGVAAVGVVLGVVGLTLDPGSSAPTEQALHLKLEV